MFVPKKSCFVCPSSLLPIIVVVLLFFGEKEREKVFLVVGGVGGGGGGPLKQDPFYSSFFVPGPSISKVQLSVYTTRISDIYKKNTIVKLSALNKCCRLHFNIINLQMFFRGEKSHI